MMYNNSDNYREPEPPLALQTQGSRSNPAAPVHLPSTVQADGARHHPHHPPPPLPRHHGWGLRLHQVKTLLITVFLK